MFQIPNVVASGGVTKSGSAISAGCVHICEGACFFLYSVGAHFSVVSTDFCTVNCLLLKVLAAGLPYNRS
jgi:hypothetical protein